MVKTLPKTKRTFSHVPSNFWKNLSERQKYFFLRNAVESVYPETTYKETPKKKKGRPKKLTKTSAQTAASLKKFTKKQNKNRCVQNKMSKLTI